MYLQHFQLEKSPFSLTPDPNFLFLTDRHREALAALLFSVTQHKGFLVLTGKAGTGKTTLVRKLLASVPSHCAQFSIVVNPALNRSELLESVLLDFGERNLPSSKAMQLVIFRDHLWRAHRAGKTCVLVIDEAHLLTHDLLEEVRLLSNFETTEQKLLQIILAGQEELDQVLAAESMTQLRQRVAIRMHIDPLSQEDVGRYLLARWTRARSPNPLPFSTEAVQLIARYSAGTPRVINVICDAALVNAYGAGTRAIGTPEVSEVLRDLGLASVGPTNVRDERRAVSSFPAVAPVERKPVAPAQEMLAGATATGTPPPRPGGARICIPRYADEPPAASAVANSYSATASAVRPGLSKRWRLNWFGAAGSEAK